ncbi:MAG: ATP-binding protein [Saprospiraceae bacterium]
MIHRRLENQLISAINRSPSVVLIGPRQIGKTTLARQIAIDFPSIYIDLEKGTDRLKISDIHSFHEVNKDKLIILDEVQLAPEIFAELRGIIDEQRRAGHKNKQFLFLGSASLDLLRQTSESLAGRIALLELHPIDVLEYPNPGDLNTIWLRGGFPESLLALSDEDSLEWRHQFIRTYLERDIPQIGPRIPAETLYRFWSILANLQGSPLNSAPLSKNLDVSQTTVRRYLDLMVDLMLVRRLSPWSQNLNKRLLRSPKIYIRDSGITHALLQIQNYNALLGHPVQGGSWEGFVIENISSVLPYHVRMYYYRSQAGAEIDLILEFSPTEKWAIEIKRSSVPSIGKGFYIAADDIKATRRYVVYAGKDKFSLGKGVMAISLREMMEAVMKEGG